MRFTCFIFAFISIAHADQWVITNGGLSPDRKLGVAVYPQKTELIDEADGTVLLVDVKQKKIIGPLEEVDSIGGIWGKTTENVHCAWSADSRLLAVNFRAGRMMSSFQLYWIEGRRAIPLTLPDPRTHPKGKILDLLGYNANPGAAVELKADGTIIESRWGFMPKEGHWDEDYSRFGIKGFDAVGGELMFHYKMDKNGKIRVVDVTLEPETE